jgi:cell division protein FtsQ
LQNQETKNTSRRKKILRKTFSHVQKISLIVLIWSALVGGLWGLYRLVFEKGIFIVKGVEVEGNLSHLNAETIKQASGISSGMNIFSINLDVVQNKINALPWVKEAAVARKIPSTIWIYVNEFTPSALLVQDRIYLVDSAGKKFKELDADDEKNFPVITGVNSDEELKNAMDLLYAYEKSPLQDYFLPAEINIDAARGNSVVLSGIGAVVRLGYENASAKLTELYSMLGAISSYKGKIRYVDLNIPGKVVVKYEN